MKKTKKCLIIFFFLILLSGCWVRLPSDGIEDSQKHVDKTYILNRDLVLVTQIMVPMAWELEDKDNIGKNQKILAILEKGSEIKITGIVYRRLSAGIFYYYVCRDLKTNRKFDLGFDISDSLGLPTYLQ